MPCEVPTCPTPALPCSNRCADHTVVTVTSEPVVDKLVRKLRHMTPAAKAEFVMVLEDVLQDM